MKGKKEDIRITSSNAILLRIYPKRITFNRSLTNVVKVSTAG